MNAVSHAARHRLLLGIVRLVGIVLLAIGVAACRDEQPAGPTGTAPQRVTLRLKWLHQAQFAGFYLAADRGLYSAEGLNVQIESGGVDFPAVQHVAKGAADFGVTGADQILIARDKGIPIVALAVIYRESPFLYFTLQSSRITKLEQFVGRKVGVKLGGNEELTYRAMTAKAGIPADRIDEVPVKYDMTQLFTGNVVAWPGYSINEPLVAEEQGHPVHRIWPKDYGISLYADTLFTTEELLKKDPDLVRRVVAASLAGWNYAIAHPEEAVQATLKRGEELKEEHETKMMQASIPLLKPDARPIGSMERQKWEELSQLLITYKFIKKPADVDAAFTTRYLPQQ